MPYVGLDSVAENFTPQQIVNDMRAVRARLIGLYVFNNDVLNPGAVVKTAAFVQQLEQLYGGPCVLPIVTIRSGDTPDPHFLVQDLLAWFPGAGRRVAHDRENTAFPPVDYAGRLNQAWKAAGFSPGGYGFDNTRQLYVPAGDDWSWGVGAYNEGFGYLPPGYAMWQWTDNVLNFTYDGSTVDDSFSVVSGTFQPPSASKETLGMYVFRNDDDGSEYIVTSKSVDYVNDPGEIALYQQVMATAHGTTADLAKIKSRTAARWPTTPA